MSEINNMGTMMNVDTVLSFYYNGRKGFKNVLCSGFPSENNINNEIRLSTPIYKANGFDFFISIRITE